MHPGHLTCPNCSTPLRVSDRRLIGRQVDCPDCAEPMLVVADGHRDLALRPVDAAAARPAAAVAETTTMAATAVESKRSHRWSRMLPWWEALKSPVGVAWTVAGVVTLAFAALLFPGGEDEPASAAQANQIAESQPPAAEETAVTAPATWRQPATSNVPAEPPARPADAPRNGIPNTPGDAAPGPVVQQQGDPRMPAEPEGVLFVAEVDAVPPVVAPQPLATVADRPEDGAVSPAEETPTTQPVDIEAALAQPIVRFQQTRPARVSDLLLQLEEMAGVPIEADEKELGGEYSRLTATVSLDLQNTTVGEILDSLLGQFGWSADIRDNTIYVIPATR